MSTRPCNIEAVARAICERDLRRASVPEAQVTADVDRYWHCVAAELEAGLFDDSGHLMPHSYDVGLAAYRDWLQRHGPSAS